MPSSPVLEFKAVTNAEGNVTVYELDKVIQKLMTFFIKDFNVLKDYPLTLIISFDEAHPLAMEEDGPWTKFSELRHALRIIHLYPCFSIFLSTTGKISQFMPGPRNDPSGRVQEGLLTLTSPFCELGFDQLAKRACLGQTTLETISSLEFMASLGHPL